MRAPFSRKKLCNRSRMTLPVVKTWRPFQGAQMLSVGRAAPPPMKKLAALRGKPGLGLRIASRRPRPSRLSSISGEPGKVSRRPRHPANILLVPVNAIKRLHLLRQTIFRPGLGAPWIEGYCRRVRSRKSPECRVERFRSTAAMATATRSKITLAPAPASQSAHGFLPILSEIIWQTTRY